MSAIYQQELSVLYDVGTLVVKREDEHVSSIRWGKRCVILWSLDEDSMTALRMAIPFGWADSTVDEYSNHHHKGAHTVIATHGTKTGCDTISWTTYKQTVVETQIRKDQRQEFETLARAGRFDPVYDIMDLVQRYSLASRIEKTYGKPDTLDSP